MKLTKLFIESSSSKGWQSEELIFGNDITQIFALNGSGKTPIVQFIVYALGYSAKFREDIYQNCEYVNLYFEHNKDKIQLKRKICTEFHVELYSKNKRDVFYMEEKLTSFLFELLNIKYPTLISIGKEPIHPYLSTLLPLLFLNQDTGYSNLYKAPSVFIKDQYSEMIRLIFDILPKHSFDQKKEIFNLKSQQDLLDKEIVKSKKLIDSMSSSTGNFEKDHLDIIKNIENHTYQIDNLSNSRTLKNDLIINLDNLIFTKQKKIQIINNNILELETRIDSFEKIKIEIELEINTLSLNEESKRIFQSFNEICYSQNCGLFMKSSESYGKNLLYLKDQIKDMQRNSFMFQKEITMLNESKENLIDDIKRIEVEVSQMNDTQESKRIVNGLNELFKEVFQLEQTKQSYEYFFEEKKKLTKRVKERERVQDSIASLTGGKNGINTKLYEIKTQMKEKLIFWLDILKTKNVSRNIEIDNDFKPTFNGEKLSQIQGSTLIRVVLAIHATIFEVYLKNSSRNILRFLIFDTPRQQELDLSDLSEFLGELKNLCNLYNAQLIYSTTSYRYECDINDKEWLATFEGFEQKMFLGITK